MNVGCLESDSLEHKKHKWAYIGLHFRSGSVVDDHSSFGKSSGIPELHRQLLQCPALATRSARRAYPAACSSAY